MIAFSALALAGCGGGSSGGDTGGGTPTTPTTNTPPTLVTGNADQDGAVGWAFSYDATDGGAAFSDADGDVLVYEVTFSPDANGLTADGGTISGVPAATGAISVTITATDGDGGSASDSFTISVGVVQDAVQAAFEGAIDLENLANYANQPVPDYITKFGDGDNPATDAGATLGRVLFYDVATSIDDTVSCASCHIQSHGFSDPAVQSAGVEGGVTRRHSMRLINTAFADETRFFWDERAASQEDQETQPLADHNEHGFSGEAGRGDLDDLIAKLEAIGYYEELFRFAFLSPEITEERLGLALAQFVKSIHSFDSRYDAGRAQVNGPNAAFPNFTAEENAGKSLFLDGPADGGAGCQGCHREPEFDIRPGSRHNGVTGEAGDPAGSDLTNQRAPTLRDLVQTDGTENGPFFHDGSAASLRDVIDHYDAVEAPADPDARSEFLATIDQRLVMGNGEPQRLNLTEGEKDQLIAFLATLAGESVYTDERYADPFPE